METVLNYILIDFENIQPNNLELLLGNNQAFKVLLLVGNNQTKIPIDLALAMQQLGGQYVKINGTGKNNLDFHLSFYLGELIAKEPQAYFHIISEDTGFDPLIVHLKSRKIKIQRTKTLGEILAIQVVKANTLDEKIVIIVNNLSGRKQSKPNKVKTLTSSINSLFGKKLTEQELSNLINELQKKHYIKIDGEQVSYPNLPQKNQN